MEDETIDLAKAEVEAQRETVAHHIAELNLIDATNKTFIDGFNIIRTRKYRVDIDIARLLLLTRSYHSFRCAIDLMKKAYYCQAVSVLRMMTEDFLLYENLAKDPELVRSFLHKSKLNTKYFEWARNADVPELYKLYQTQCDFTHPSGQSVSTLLDGNVLKIVPVYDHTLFMMCAEMLLKRDSLMMIISLLTLVPDSPTAQSQNAKDFSQELSALKKSIEEWRNTLKANYEASA